jgi:hypothetical protein
VVVDFMVTTPGAIIRVDGTALAGTRFEGPPRSAPAHIRVEAPGFDAFEIQMTLDRSMVVPISMSKSAVATETPAAKPEKHKHVHPIPSMIVPPPPTVTTPPVTTTPPAGDKKPKDSHIVTDSPYGTPH